MEAQDALAPFEVDAALIAALRLATPDDRMLTRCADSEKEIEVEVSK